MENIMFVRLGVVAAVTVLLTLAACSDSEVAKSGQITSAPEASDAGEPESAALTIPSYEILEDEVQRNVKRTVEVRLASRTDEDSLKVLAQEIYDLSKAKVERTFIGYRIAGEGSDQAFWATTNYDPDLKIHIMGKNAKDYERLKSMPLPEGEILGSWMVSDGIDYRIVAYMKGGKAYMQTIYDTKGSDKEYELTETDEGIKLELEDVGDFKEYYIINKAGDLEFWSENGNYFTAKKS